MKNNLSYIIPKSFFSNMTEMHLIEHTILKNSYCIEKKLLQKKVVLKAYVEARGLVLQTFGHNSFDLDMIIRSCLSQNIDYDFFEREKDLIRQEISTSRSSIAKQIIEILNEKWESPVGNEVDLNDITVNSLNYSIKKIINSNCLLNKFKSLSKVDKNVKAYNINNYFVISTKINSTNALVLCIYRFYKSIVCNESSIFSSNDNYDHSIMCFNSINFKSFIFGPTNNSASDYIKKIIFDLSEEMNNFGVIWEMIKENNIPYSNFGYLVEEISVCFNLEEIIDSLTRADILCFTKDLISTLGEM